MLRCCPPRALIAALCLAAAACGSPRPAPGDTASVGLANDGYLRGGVSLPDHGPGYRRGRPGEETRFGTPALVGAVKRAARSVAEVFPGGPPLRVGDLSSAGGGAHPRHGSHRSGRDVDIIFYATDDAGRATQGRGWLSYDRFGLARESHPPAGVRGGGLYNLDVARNWHFVRSLLTDPEVEVQWIFCSSGVKAQLLRHAALHEPDPDVLLRASWILHQPSSGNPHADHFHIRVYCGPTQSALGCIDDGPRWAWLSDEAFKSAEAVDAADDAALLEAMAPL